MRQLNDKTALMLTLAACLLAGGGTYFFLMCNHQPQLPAAPAVPLVVVPQNVAPVPPATTSFDPNSVANLRLEAARRRQLFGSESTNVADTLGLLSSVLRDEGRLAEAEAARRENLAIRRQALGDDHPQVATSYDALGTILQREGRLAEAKTSLREALAIRRKVYGEQSAPARDTLARLNEVLKSEGKPAE